MRFTFKCINVSCAPPTDAFFVANEKELYKVFRLYLYFVHNLSDMLMQIIAMILYLCFFPKMCFLLWILLMPFFKSKKFGTSNSVIRILFNKLCFCKTCGFRAKNQTFCQYKQQNAFTAKMYRTTRILNRRR